MTHSKCKPLRYFAIGYILLNDEYMSAYAYAYMPVRIVLTIL